MSLFSLFLIIFGKVNVFKARVDGALRNFLGEGVPAP